MSRADPAVLTFTVKTKGTAVICPNTPQQKTVEKDTYYTIGVPATCPPTSSGGGTTGGYVYTGGGGTGGQGGGGSTPGGSPVPINTGNPCDCKQNGEPCPDDGNICTADKCEGGNCAHPPDDSKTPPQNAYGDCKKERCSGGSPVSVPDDADEPAEVCKKCSGGQVTNIPDGEKAKDNASCCFDGQGIPNAPISNLEQCPNKVAMPGHVPQANGCNFSFENPMLFNHATDEEYFNYHSETDGLFTPGCDFHDKCYDECNKDRAYCDVEFGNRLRDICNRDYNQTTYVKESIWREECLMYASTYETAVIGLGWLWYNNAQKNACNCCY